MFKALQLTAAIARQKQQQQLKRLRTLSMSLPVSSQEMTICNRDQQVHPYTQRGFSFPTGGKII
jgi:hypothetical protein